MAEAASISDYLYLISIFALACFEGVNVVWSVTPALHTPLMSVTNAISSIMIFISMRFGQIILIGAALSFLGLGARPPTAELGMMAAQGRDFLLFAPHIAVIPSELILLIVLPANNLGEA